MQENKIPTQVMASELSEDEPEDEVPEPERSLEVAESP
jgi:hypothetical protein